MESVPHRLLLWMKIPYTIFMLVLVPVYWYHLGPQNFLWGSDIALLLALIAIWREWALPASMAMLITLIPDVAWNLDLLARLAGVDMLGINATAYMMDETLPLIIRLLSLFHVFLAPMLLWIIFRLGYDTRALLWQILLTIVVLPLSYYFTEPERNINWVHGIGTVPPPWPEGIIHVLAMMLIVSLFVYLPTHFLLQHYFRK